MPAAADLPNRFIWLFQENRPKHKARLTPFDAPFTDETIIIPATCAPIEG
jgi:hypothetical protein